MIKSKQPLCVTWNILAQKHCNESIPWDYRLNQIKFFLREIHDFSIICLQEVDLATFKDDFAEFAYDYIITYNNLDDNIGCVTMYKNDEWNVIEKINSSTGVHTIAIHMETGLHVWLSNIHLKPGLISGEHARVSQIKSTIKRIKKNDNYPAIICGDFNDNLHPHRRLYKLLSDEGFKIKKPSKYPLSCYTGEKFFRFDRAISDTFNIKYPNVQNPRKSIPNDNTPSNHYFVEFILDLQ